MKRSLILLSAIISLAVACQQPDDVVSGDPVVVLPDGPVVLQDTEFGMYYGDLDDDGIGLFSIVLSDARCYQDKLNSPYLDSEGDMLVLQIRTPLFAEDEQIALPDGEYTVSEEIAVSTIDAAASYVKRQVGSMQSRWTIESGVIDVVRGESGEYDITTRDFVITKDGQKDTVDYVCMSSLSIADYLYEAPSRLGVDEDIIDMPFTDVQCIYHGNLYGNGTGNFLVNLSTKGFVTEEGEVNDIPGIYITLNFFSRLYSGNSEPVLEEGRYTVSTTSSNTLMQRWSLLPGLYLETTPFGSYVLQQPAEGEGTMEFISSGMVDVSYEEVEESENARAVKAKKMVLSYSFKTSTREISGVWKGLVTVDDQAEGSNESYLTTLDHDVDCDMSKVTGGTLTLIETLHRENVVEEWNYNIAEAWQLYLQPRDWTEEEYAIPWLQDDNNNGIPDRLEAYCADGDVMILEFVLPLGSQGQIAPELGKTYTYTLQPNLSVDHEMYEIYVSRMGRPYDEIFDAKYAADNYGWAETLGITSYDRCNARRGFTWSTDGWRGNWYMHYETGRHMVLDGYAPAINGYVNVTRTGDDVYDFEWDFIDDNPGTPNKITGSIKDCKVKINVN